METKQTTYDKPYTSETNTDTEKVLIEIAEQLKSIAESLDYLSNSQRGYNFNHGYDY